MRKSKIRYIFTWISLGMLLLCSLLLLIFSWNSILNLTLSPSIMVLLWLFIAGSGIFLFMLAAKKAHRQLIDETLILKKKEGREKKQKSINKEPSKDTQSLDFSAVARKLVRRTPENASLEDVGKGLLKNLARELEIMAGIFYLSKKTGFESSSSYALALHSEPYKFKEGDGLTGQVARNQQLMVLTRLPEDYLEVYSGLGQSKPTYLAIVPLIHKNRTMAVLECSGYKYDPGDIENMFRIFSRDLMDKISPNL